MRLPDGTILLACKCGGLPILHKDEARFCYWVECGKCGVRTDFCQLRQHAIESWNRTQAEWAQEVPEPPEIPLEPIEGRTDCSHYIGFVGVIASKERPIPQMHGVMHCKYHEYLNAICGVKSLFGGVYTDLCERCTRYEPKKGEKSDE